MRRRFNRLASGAPPAYQRCSPESTRRQQSFPSPAHGTRERELGCGAISKAISHTYAGTSAGPAGWHRPRNGPLLSAAPKRIYFTAVKLSGLFVYPIKACGGVALEAARVVERGLALDRRYMLIDRSGTFITQREAPRLCLVRTELTESSIVVRSPHATTLELPHALAEGEPAPCRVWGDACSALCHAEGSRWFAELMNEDVRLVYMPESERRAVNPRRARAGDIVSFADGYPCLVISEASLSDLNARSPEPLTMTRFRPNLVISGCEPYAEDGFERLRVGEVDFRAVKRCDRCVVTTVDPSTGERGREPLRTLAQYRLEDGKVWFGMNLIHDGPGVLRVGDECSAILSA